MTLQIYNDNNYINCNSNSLLHTLPLQFSRRRYPMVESTYRNKYYNACIAHFIVGQKKMYSK